MTTEVNEFLEHAGVKGMKWGKRKAVTPVIDKKTGGVKKPGYVRQLAIGTIGNSKGRFTDPKALATRTNSGKLAAAAVLTSLASTGIQLAALNSKNPGVSNGAAAAAGLLQKGAGALSVAALATGVVAVRQERVARSSNGS